MGPHAHARGRPAGAAAHRVYGESGTSTLASWRLVEPSFPSGRYYYYYYYYSLTASLSSRPSSIGSPSTSTLVLVLGDAGRSRCVCHRPRWFEIRKKGNVTSREMTGKLFFQAREA